MMHTSGALPRYSRVEAPSLYELHRDEEGKRATFGGFSEMWEPLRRSSMLRRCLHVNQMDFEAAVDDMLSLCFGDPTRIFKQAYYRKQTKNSWARDDPAFAMLQILFVVAAAFAYGFALSAQRALTYVYLALVAVCAQYLACGLIIASAHTWLANRYMREKKWTHSVEQKVEWLYAFDVHCNAFFAYFACAYVAHFFLLPLALGSSFFSMLVANSMHVTAVAAYCYITHLGFRALPYLRRTEIFLYPILAAAAALLLTVTLGVLGWKLNVSRIIVALVFAPLA